MRGDYTLVSVLASAVLAALMIPATAMAGCTITVSHNDDPSLAGNVTGDRDNKLTFREALQIGIGNLRCYTDFEKARISSANFVHDPVLCQSVDNTINWRLSASNPGCGPNDEDNIRFDDNPVGGNTVNMSSVAIFDPRDSIAGDAPTPGARSNVVLHGPGSASGATPGAITTDVLDSDAATGTIKNLYIENYRGYAIWAKRSNGFKVFGVGMSAISADASGFADGVVLGERIGPANPDRCVFSAQIGGTGAGQQNYFYNLGGSAIAIWDTCPGDVTDRNNKIFNNYIGICEELDTGVGLDGCPSGTPNQNLGAFGVTVFDTNGTRIGGSGVNEGNVIARAGIAGVQIGGDDAANNTIRGNRIGLARAINAARPNARGVLLQTGAHSNSVGGAATGEGNVIAGNTQQGVYIDGVGTSFNSVTNNIIGLNPNRTGVIANGADGIAVNNSANGNAIQDNVIAGNGLWGIYLGSSSATTVQRNAIGLRGFANTANDNTASPNGSGGVRIDNGVNQTVGLGNRIAGNNGPGVFMFGDGTSGTVVSGNVVGLANDNSPRPNTNQGVWVQGGPDNTVIGGSVAARNTISGNNGAGVRIEGPGTVGVDVNINRIGTNPSGSGDLGNSGEGVYVGSGASGVMVRNNFIGGNNGDGVKLTGNANTAGNGTQVMLNIIGVTGATAVGNGASGVSLLAGTTNAVVGDTVNGNSIGANGGFGVFIGDAGTSSNQVRGNTIGNDVIAQANASGGVTVRGASSNTVAENVVIGHANGPGIELMGAGTTLNTVSGNRVGINASNVAIANQAGIRVVSGAANNTIGGTLSADRNLIGGNALYGVTFAGSGTSNNTLRGNSIGLDNLGTAIRANGIGVLIEGGASGNSVLLNTVSGNTGDGVRIRETGSNANSVKRNRIGLTASGSGAAANGGAGVHVLESAGANVIGAALADANLIRFNTGDGIWIESGIGNNASANAVFDNGGLGIDLGTDGVSANDSGDGDSGANSLLNFPQLTNVARGGNMVSMTLSLSSQASSSFTVHASYVLSCDPSGNGEGDGPLGGVALSTGAGGSGTVSAMFPLSDTTPLTAFTALAQQGQNTSEYSLCIASAPPPALIFANGFESGSESPAATTSPALRSSELTPGIHIQRVSPDHANFSFNVVNGGDFLLPARSIAIGSDRALGIGRIRAAGAACSLSGAIVCEVPELGPHQTASIAVELALDTQAPTTIIVESRDGGGTVTVENAVVGPMDD